ncbi:protein phosphatase 2C domain-containing protein [uncultured Amaricoccus sp.]|uniref:PP2C family protein-serine/threonine phosphatase n=1 Tax=uncultured Amaricoccus sp. TaxID=339341 RepID=UPI00260F2150|nr:protein phosphatase 2C domain-containing protein [uncultured Amaricoccus sp.]
MTGPVTRVPPPRPAALVEGAGLTHAGRVRDANEDAILTDPSGALWAVADGMGGYGHGEIAADIVIDTLSRLPHGAPPALLVTALEAANAEVRRRAADGLGRMGATVVAAMVAAEAATIAWVGDSRAYRLSGGRLGRLTHDHSVVQELIDRGQLDPAAAEADPRSHIVTRAIGADERLEVALTATPLTPGDALLLCSDGLSKCVPEAEIATILGAISGAEAAPAEICAALVEAALHRGAPDNVSVIVVRASGAGRR